METDPTQPGLAEAKHPTLRQSMLAALGNVNPSHLLDKKLFPAHDAPSESHAGVIAATALLRSMS